jgi:hypothetical protein
VTRGLWIAGTGRELVCDQWTASGDVILIENFDQEYPAVRARSRTAPKWSGGSRAGADGRVERSDGPELGVTRVEVMASVARLPHPEIIPFREGEWP